MSNYESPHKHLDTLQSGDVIDVKAKSGEWYEATVLKVKRDRFYIRYNGWANEWNEWIDADSDRLARRFTHTQADSDRDEGLITAVELDAGSGTESEGKALSHVDPLPHEINFDSRTSQGRQCLNLSNQFLSSASIDSLAAYLSVNPNLTDINLSWTQIEITESKKLATALKELPYLKILDLSGNHVVKSKHIFQMLRTSSLEVLSLAWCPIRTRKVLKIVHDTSTLQELNVSGNQELFDYFMEKEGNLEILKKNRMLRVINFQDCHLPPRFDIPVEVINLVHEKPKLKIIFPSSIPIASRCYYALLRSQQLLFPYVLAFSFLVEFIQFLAFPFVLGLNLSLQDELAAPLFEFFIDILKFSHLEFSSSHESNLASRFWVVFLFLFSFSTLLLPHRKKGCLLFRASREKQKLVIGELFLHVVSAMCFIPFMRTLLKTLYCPLGFYTIEFGGTMLACWQGEHLVFSALALVSMPAYLLASFRLCRIDGSVRRIKWGTYYCDWRNDEVQNPKHIHYFSNLAPLLSLSTLLLKLLFVFGSVFFPSYQLLLFCFYLTMMLGLLITTYIANPFYIKQVHCLKLAGCCGILWTYIVATYAELSHSVPDNLGLVWLCGFLPICFSAFLASWWLLWERSDPPLVDEVHLPITAGYSDRLDSALYIAPAGLIQGEKIPTPSSSCSSHIPVGVMWALHLASLALVFWYTALCFQLEATYEPIYAITLLAGTLTLTLSLYTCLFWNSDDGRGLVHFLWILLAGGFAVIGGLSLARKIPTSNRYVGSALLLIGIFACFPCSCMLKDLCYNLLKKKARTFFHTVVAERERNLEEREVFRGKENDVEGCITTSDDSDTDLQ